MSDRQEYLERLKVRPDPDNLTARERSHLQVHFDPHAAEVVVNGETIAWTEIDEIEVVPAARMRGAAGWMVKFMYGEDRYHVGIYFGRNEAVLTNLSRQAAEYVARSIAFFAPRPVRYRGIEGLTPLAYE